MKSLTPRRNSGSARVLIITAIVVVVAIAGVALVRSRSTPPTESAPIAIGVINPTTGPFAAFGGPVRDGLVLAVEDLNANGGVNGRKIELVMEDDGGDPKKSVSAFLKLATVTKVPVVIGPLSSGASMATAPLADHYKVVQVSTLAGTIDLTKAGDFVFRIYPSSEVGSRYITRQAIGRFKAKRIAIFYPNNAVGVTSRKLIAEIIKDSGAEIVADEAFKDGDRDFRAQLTKIGQSRPDVILCSAYYEEGAQILVQAKQLGVNVPILGEDGWFGPIAAIARDALQNLFFANVAFGPEYASDAEMQRFITAFEHRYGRKPNSAAATGYAALQVVSRAIATGGVDSAKIRDALYRTDTPTVFGKVKYDQNGDNVGAVYDLFQLNQKDEPILVK